MPPQEKDVSLETETRQSLFIIRHGDRYDYMHKEVSLILSLLQSLHLQLTLFLSPFSFVQWAKSSSRPGDPPLSSMGLQQARETGIYLDSLLSSEGLTGKDIVWMSSPFLRCIQTSHTAMDAFRKINGSDKLKILPEYSIFEWDGYDGQLHKSLPPLDERTHYFPRLDAGYDSLFVPQLPEPRSAFYDRCSQSVQAISQRYRYRPATALIAVTHAAACIYMAAAASNQTADRITPAAPCSIFRLTRTSDTAIWTIDEHDAFDSMNGYTSHLSELSNHTVPWHNFADKKVFGGYSGPPTSRFAPEGYTSTGTTVCAASRTS
jgi:broad specificity phosphatase PhoE